MSEEDLSLHQGQCIRSIVLQINDWLAHGRLTEINSLLSLLKKLSDNAGVEWKGPLDVATDE